MKTLIELNIEKSANEVHQNGEKIKFELIFN